MRRTALAAAALVGVLALTACTANGTTSTSAPNSGKDTSRTLTIGEVLPPISFAVNGYADGAPIEFFSAVFDTLLRTDANGNATPGLATKWAYDSARTTLTLTIRKGVEFSDGTKVTPAAVAENIKRFVKSTAPEAPLVASVKDAVVSGDTVKLELKQPDPNILGLLHGALGFVSSPKSWSNPNVATDPVGAGPYVLDTSATVIGSSYVYKKNPKYWDKSVERFSTLTLKVIADPTAIVNAIRAKEIDAAQIVDLSTLPVIESAGFDANTIHGAAWQGILLMDRAGKIVPALKDIRVRQAMSYAIDRKGLLAATIGTKNGQTTNQFFTPPTQGFASSLDNAYPYDPAKARKLLAEAGYPNGFDLTMPSLSLMSPALLSSMKTLLGAVGIRVTYVDDGANYLPDVVAGKFAAAWFQLGCTTDWTCATNVATPTALFNPFHTQSAETNALLKTMQTGSDAAAAAASKKLNAYMTKNAWFSSFYSVNSVFVSSPSLSVKVSADQPAPYIYNITTK